MKKLLLFVLAIAGGLSARATDQISIKHLKTFPDVIVAGMSYTLEAYIHNDGSSNIGSGQKMNILMSVGGGNAVILQQNYTAGVAVAPGDSILWTLPGYVFTTSLFDGGMNDVLVWPEMPGGQVTVADSAHKKVLYTKSAAFSVYNNGVFGLPTPGTELTKSYDIVVRLENGGSWANSNPVHLFIQFENQTPYRIADHEGAIEAGRSAKVRIPSFVLAFYLQYCWFESDLPENFQIFAVEVSGVSALQKASFPILTPISTNLEAPHSDLVQIYPNPAKSEIQLLLDPSINIDHISILDVNGRAVWDKQPLEPTILVDHLPAGAYFLILEGPAGRLTKKFIKE